MGKCKIQAAAGSDMSIANGKIVRGLAETGTIDANMFVSKVTNAETKLPSSYMYVIPLSKTRWLALAVSGSSSSYSYKAQVLTLNESTGSITQGTAVEVFYAPYDGIKNLFRINENTIVCVINTAYTSGGTVYVYKLVISGNTITVTNVPLESRYTDNTQCSACLIDNSHVMVAVSSYSSSYSYAGETKVYTVDLSSMSILNSSQVSSYSSSGTSRYQWVGPIAKYKGNKYCVSIKDRNYKSDSYKNIILNIGSNYSLTVSSTTSVSGGSEGLFSNTVGKSWMVEDGYWVVFNSAGKLELYSGDDSIFNNSAIQTIVAPSGNYKGAYRTPNGRIVLIAGSNIYEYVWGSDKRFTQVLLGTSSIDFGSTPSYTYTFDNWITDDLELFLFNSSGAYWLDTIERLKSILFKIATSSSGITGMSQDSLKENELGKVWVLKE